MDNYKDDPGQKTYEALFVIVNFGVGSKVLHFGKKHGLTGGTLFLGKGTRHSFINDFLDIYDERVEVLLTIASSDVITHVAEAISQKFKFSKPHHGIAFTAKLDILSGMSDCSYSTIETENEKGAEKEMYEAIFAIADRGNAETIVNVAESAGARGGTIINARGAGIHERSKLFAMEIEPEKEVVLIILEKEKTQAVVDAIHHSAEMDKPGNGIIFTIGVNNTYGLYQNNHS